MRKVCLKNSSKRTERQIFFLLTKHFLCVFDLGGILLIRLALDFKQYGSRFCCLIS